MKSKHISEPFLESARAGGGGGASSRAAAARLLYCARGRTLLLSHLGNLHSSCSSSQMTAAPRVHAGVWADRRREGQREPCKTGTQLILWITGIGCSIRIPPSRHGSCAVRCLLTAIFQAGKTPNRLLCSRSTLSKVLLKRGNEPICILLLKHGGMFLVTLHCMFSFAPGLLVG